MAWSENLIDPFSGEGGGAHLARGPLPGEPRRLQHPASLEGLTEPLRAFSMAALSGPAMGHLIEQRPTHARASIEQGPRSRSAGYRNKASGNSEGRDPAP
jgi:hypothetical protein